MILIIILGGFLTLFGIYYLIVEKLIHKKETILTEAEIIDEAEDVLLDNTGGRKVRFFKVYSYNLNGEEVIAKSTRPRIYLTNSVGQKVKIYVDNKNRLATETGDMILKNVLSVLMIVFGVLMILVL